MIDSGKEEKKKETHTHIPFEVQSEISYYYLLNGYERENSNPRWRKIKTKFF